MKSACALAILLSNSALAAGTLVTDPVARFARVLSTTPKYDDVKLNWDLRLTTTNDAVATGRLIAAPVKGKAYTRALGVTADLTVAQSSAINNMLDIARKLGGTCMSVPETALNSWYKWSLERLRDQQSGTFERAFGRALARVVIADNGPSATVTFTFVRNGDPGSATWANFCTVR